jgi:hypothetical protein
MRATDANQNGYVVRVVALRSGLPADAVVVSRFYDVFLLLLATGFFPVDGLHCFGSGSFSTPGSHEVSTSAQIFTIRRQFLDTTIGVITENASYSG